MPRLEIQSSFPLFGLLQLFLTSVCISIGVVELSVRLFGSRQVAVVPRLLRHYILRFLPSWSRH
jgi:hypothetical protein